MRVVRRRRLYLAALLVVASACTRPDPAGQYALSFATMGGRDSTEPVVPGSDTIRAGQMNSYGEMTLHAGGRLEGNATVSGIPMPLSGTWFLEGKELHLNVSARQILRAERRRSQLSFEYPLEDTHHMAYGVALRSDLRNLVAAQESYFADAARYTTNLGTLGFRSSTGVTRPQITLVRGGGYTAEVTHPSAPGLRCAIAVFADNPIDRNAGDADPVCTRPQPTDTTFLRLVWRRVER